MTRWLYDQPTGLLTNKVYADGSRVTYAYAPDGKLASRVWARGVTATYAYDSLGQLAGINYSGTTPDVSFGYDRLGRTVSAITAASTNLFEYSGLDLVAEIQNGETLTRNCDALGRSAGFGLADGFTAAYGYDDFGRMNLVVSGTPSGTNEFRYAYLAGTDLVGSMTNSAGFWWRRIHEQNRDLIASVENGFGDNAVSSFAYGNDADGRRALRVDSGSVTNLFGYNVRSEVVGAAMGTNAYEYGYDPIGNRVFSAVNALTNAYTANALNQYTAISGGWAVSPTYDSDGNTTWDGRFFHAWDAENRLIRSQPAGTVTNGSVMVENVYDYRSRRIRKTVRQLTGRGAGYPMDPSQAGTWGVVETRQYVYDGWNVIRETVSAAGNTATNHYVWGLDLSGSLQGAGGVGGLLAEMKAGVPHYPAFDANGNVAEYVDAFGNVCGHFEYDAFGNTIVRSGDLAQTLSIRFSTKNWDDETGLIMYQRRPFSPLLVHFLVRDTIEEKGGDNLYAFCLNDSINSVDPLGEASVSWTYLFYQQFVEPHYRELSGQLAERLESLCPKEGTQKWTKNGQTACCVAASCKTKAQKFAVAYVEAIKNVWWAEFTKWGNGKGGLFGNLHAGSIFNKYQGDTYLDWQDGNGLKCEGWQSLGTQVFYEIMGQSGDSCWNYDHPVRPPNIFELRLLRHTWLQVIAPNGSQDLDPWSSGGWNY